MIKKRPFGTERLVPLLRKVLIEDFLCFRFSTIKKDIWDEHVPLTIFWEVCANFSVGEGGLLVGTWSDFLK